MVETRGMKRTRSGSAASSPNDSHTTDHSDDYSDDSRRSRYSLRTRQSNLNYAEKKQKRAPPGTSALYSFGFLTDPPVSTDSDNRDIITEVKHSPNHCVEVSYIGAVNGVNPRMRAILVDWMMEVCDDYKLQRETLQLAVILLDRYLSKNRVAKSKLQLLGVTAMLIASKMEEIDPPKVTDFIHATDEAYECEEVYAMELEMLCALSWNIVRPTVFFWMNLLMKKLVNRLQDSNGVEPVTVERVLGCGRVPFIFGVDSPFAKRPLDKNSLPELLLRMCQVVDCAILDPLFSAKPAKVVAISILSMSICNPEIMEVLLEDDELAGTWRAGVAECEEWLLQFTGIKPMDMPEKPSRDTIKKKFNLQTHSPDLMAYINQIPSVLSNSPYRRKSRSRVAMPGRSLSYLSYESLFVEPAVVEPYVRETRIPIPA